jgi:uncharacterized membrane protein
VFGAAIAVALPWYPGEPPEVAPVYERVATRVADGEIPYRDFFLEYPPASVPALLAPAAVPRASYDHAFVVLAAAALALAAGVVGLVVARRHLAARAALFVLALGPIAVTRYDAFVTLAATLGIAAVVRRRTVAGGAALAVAAAAKLYAVVLLPVVAVFLRDRGSRARRFALAFVAAGAVVCMPFAVAGPGGVRASLEYQLERPLQLESLGGSIVMLADVAGFADAQVHFEAGAQAVGGPLARPLSLVQSLVLVAGVALTVLGFARSRPSSDHLVAVAAAVLAVVVALGPVLSPQFLVWLFPLAIVVVTRPVLVILFAAAVLTQALYPNRYDELVTGEATEAALLVARNVCLVAVAALLARPWLRAVSRREGDRA